MKHFEIRNLKKNLDILIEYVDKNKITNPYLNYGLVRNSKILTKATENIDSAAPEKLKELESKMYQDGLKEFEKFTGKVKAELAKLTETEKQNKVFNLGLSLATEEDKTLRTKLAEEYNKFLELENDTVLYNLNFEGLSTLDMEIQYWGILDLFIKN